MNDTISNKNEFRDMVKSARSYGWRRDVRRREERDRLARRIGDTLVKLREISGRSRKEAATRLGISYSHLAKMESGQVIPSWESMHLFMTVYHFAFREMNREKKGVKC